MITRRNVLFGLLAAPAVIRTAGLLMPVKAIAEPLVYLDIEALPPGIYNMTLKDFARQANGLFTMRYKIIDGPQDKIIVSMRSGMQPQNVGIGGSASLVMRNQKDRWSLRMPSVFDKIRS